MVEGVGGVEGPVGVAEELAGEEDDVGLVGADDLVGLSGPVIRPTAPVGMAVSRRMRSAKATW